MRRLAFFSSQSSSSAGVLASEDLQKAYPGNNGPEGPLLPLDQCLANNWEIIRVAWLCEGEVLTVSTETVWVKRWSADHSKIKSSTSPRQCEEQCFEVALLISKRRVLLQLSMRE